ncbi:MAG: serine hydrolase domain-containing protein [Bacteroidota bacterium]
MNLDSPVTKYLPYFKMKDARYKDITVRQLLLHSSGIPDVGGSENYHWDQPEYDDQALERYVKSLAPKKLDFRPGKKYSYSNSAYNVLGDIIAKVSGKSYEAYIRESIYQPNDMQESTCERKTVPDQLAVAPHIQDKNKEVQVSSVYPYNRAHTPCSCLHSNVVDLLKWTQTQLNQGMYKEQKILGPEAYRRLSEGQIKKSKVIQASMGWDSGPLKGKTRYEYSGRDVGFQTYVLFVPEVDFALVFLSNGDFSPPAFDILLMAYDLALQY